MIRDVAKAMKPASGVGKTLYLADSSELREMAKENPSLSASESFSRWCGTYSASKSPHLAAESQIFMKSENRLWRILSFHQRCSTGSNKFG